MIGALKQVEAGRAVEDVAREVGVSKHTIYAWKAKYGGMDVSQAREAKQVRDSRWMPLRTPQGKKRTALLRKLKEMFRHLISQPIMKVIGQINPILRGWVRYFAFGHSSRCFSYVRDWVEKKIRRHLERARERRGYAWKRCHRERLYGTLGLFADYRVSYQPSVA
jgi:RNA-directed DNA polymerase